MNRLYILLFALVICSACRTSKDLTEQQEPKPNIVFILVDDLGYADVGFNGSTYYETPALDALAQQSLVFDHSYMYPTCSPSRTALFTGKHSFRTGVYTVPVLEKGDSLENIFSRWTVERKHPIYAETLAKVGYQAIHLGKWHIVGPYPEQELNQTFPLSRKLTQPNPGDYSWVDKHKTENIQQYYPEGRGFVKNVGGTFRGDPAFEEGGYKSENGGYRAPFSNPFIEPKEGDEWLTDRLTDEAIDFMEAQQGKPFFVNLHYYTVHRPIKNRTEALYEKYLTKEGDPLTGQGIGKKKERAACYATMIESLDDNIQRLIDYLDQQDLRKNTLIVFSSDNGYHKLQSDNFLMRGAKGDIYEGGIRVPTFINWPGKVTARRSEMPIGVLDYYPTFMDIAGINYDGILDGQSLTPLFREDVQTFAERPLYWHLASRNKHGTCTAMRKGPYKLIQFLKDGKIELYDLKNDQKEAHNLADTQPELAARLLQEMTTWRKENRVPLPPNSVLVH